MLILHKNVSCGYSLEMPQQGTSNEFPQLIFYEEISKIFCNIYHKIPNSIICLFLCCFMSTANS